MSYLSYSIFTWFVNIPANSFCIFSLDHCAITSDAWSDNFVHLSYNTYTHHYINDQWELKHRVLKTSHMEGSHTAERIRDEFEIMANEFGISQKNIVCVTDSAANMKKAVRILNKKHFACVAHKMNLLIQKDLMAAPKMQPLRDIVAKIRRTQKKLIYRHSQLKEIDDNDKQTKLLLLIEEISEIEKAVNAELQFGDQTDDESGHNVSFDNEWQQTTFSGLKSMSNVRWSVIYKLAKSFLDHASEKLDYFNFLSMIINDCS